MAESVPAVLFYDLGAALGRAVSVLDLACKAPPMYVNQHPHANLSTWRQRGTAALRTMGESLRSLEQAVGSGMQELQVAAQELTELQDSWDLFSGSAQHTQLVQSLAPPDKDRDEPPTLDPLNTVPYFPILGRLRDFVDKVVDRFDPPAHDAAATAFALHGFREHLPHYDDDGNCEGEGRLPADVKTLVTNELIPAFAKLDESGLQVLPNELGREAYGKLLDKTYEPGSYGRQRSTYGEWLDNQITNADDAAREFLKDKECGFCVAKPAVGDRIVWEMRPAVGQETENGTYVAVLAIHEPKVRTRGVGCAQFCFLHAFFTCKKETQRGGQIWREVSIKSIAESIRDWTEKQRFRMKEAKEGQTKLRAAINRDWGRFKNQMAQFLNECLFEQIGRGAERVFRMNVTAIELRKLTNYVPSFLPKQSSPFAP